MKQYEEAMKDPRVQAQSQQLSQVMQNPDMMKKMAELRVSSPHTQASQYQMLSPA